MGKFSPQLLAVHGDNFVDTVLPGQYYVAQRSRTILFAGRGPNVKIFAYIVTYNGGATGPCITRCVEYLAAEGPASFGKAIERIDIYIRCQTRDPMVPGLEFLMDRFQAGLATLPFIRFRRKARLFELSYASEWVHSSGMFGASKIELPPSEFDCLCRELAAVLSLVRRRVKKTDDFDMEAFEAQLQQRVESLDQHGAEVHRRTSPCT